MFNGLYMNTEDKTYIHKLLEVNLISPTALAIKMWPTLNEKTAYNKLYNKLNNIAQQRITNNDIKLAKEVCKELSDFI